MQPSMTITLNQAAIEAALVNYVNSMGVSTLGKTTEVSLTAGRKENGYSAEVTIISAANPSITTVEHKSTSEKTVDAYVMQVDPAVGDEASYEVISLEEEEELVVADREIVETEDTEAKPKKKLFGN